MRMSHVLMVVATLSRTNKSSLELLHLSCETINDVLALRVSLYSLLDLQHSKTEKRVKSKEGRGSGAATPDARAQSLNILKLPGVLKVLAGVLFRLCYVPRSRRHHSPHCHTHSHPHSHPVEEAQGRPRPAPCAPCCTHLDPEYLTSLDQISVTSCLRRMRWPLPSASSMTSAHSGKEL